MSVYMCIACWQSSNFLVLEWFFLWPPLASWASQGLVGFMRSVHVKGSAMLVAATVCVCVHNTVVGSMRTLVPLLAALSSPKAPTYHEAQSWASHGDTITGWHRTGNLITARSQNLTGSSMKTQIQWGEDSFFYCRMHKASTLYNVLRPWKTLLTFA